MTAVVIAACEHANFVVRRICRGYSQLGYGVVFVGWNRLRKTIGASGGESEAVTYLMSGWGYRNWRLAFALPLWMMRVMWYCFRHRVDVVHAVDFDSAFPARVGLFLKIGTALIYDVQDNFALRHNFPRILKRVLCVLERYTAAGAHHVVVTDTNRIVGGLDGCRDKISVIPNCPPDLPSCDGVEGPHPFTIAACGRLAKGRGIGLLLGSVSHMRDVKVLMAGEFVEPELRDEALSMSAVEYSGYLPQEEALAVVKRADIVFAFYDPSIEINCRANSAKWYDAMMAGKPLLVNRELMNAPWIEKEDIGYLCEYGSVDALLAVLQHARTHPGELAQKGRRARALYGREFNADAMRQRFEIAVNSAMEAAHVPLKSVGAV